MNYDNIYIIVFSFYITLLLISLSIFIFYVINYNNYYIFNKKPFLLVIISLLIIIYNILLLIDSFKSNIIIKITRDIVSSLTVTFIIIREINLYIEREHKEKNIKIIKNIKKLIFTIDVILLIYSLFIIIGFHDINLDDNSWQYYPYHFKYILLVFLFYPIMAFILYKKNVEYKNETICVLMILTLTYLPHISYNFIFEKSELSIIISKSIISTNILFIHWVYCTYPIYYMFKNKSIKYINEENTINFYKVNIKNKNSELEILDFIINYIKNLENKNNYDKDLNIFFVFYNKHKENINNYVNSEIIYDIKKNISENNRKKNMILIKNHIEQNILKEIYKSLI